jgi:hypothetical protein
MAKKFYNKNAREKALLEEAYISVYSESAGQALFSNPRFKVYLNDKGEWGRSSGGDGGSEPDVTSSLYDFNINDAEVFKKAGYEKEAAAIVDKFGSSNPGTESKKDYKGFITDYNEYNRGISGELPPDPVRYGLDITDAEKYEKEGSPGIADLIRKAYS